ncbi:hypothetical protein [Roseibium album]|uniref:hypothetical protein n=1 Tax=Roseibium album TaxID=311410 RepID=UPI001187746C|nr:hypothetical protein [Roseibium album]
MREAPPDGSASEITFDDKGRPLDLGWHSKDLAHREGAAASIRVNPENGVHIVEQFRTHGKYPARSFGYSVIVRDSETGRITNKYHEGDYAIDDPTPLSERGMIPKL